MSITAHGSGSGRNGLPERKPYRYRGNGVDGQRRFWVRPVPPSLAARLAIPTRPMPPAPPKRCRRCGYLKTRCACGRGGA